MKKFNLTEIIGKIVSHNKLGKGSILSCDDKNTAKIQFAGDMVKTIDLKIALPFITFDDKEVDEQVRKYFAEMEQVKMQKEQEDKFNKWLFEEENKYYSFHYADSTWTAECGVNNNNNGYIYVPLYTVDNKHNYSVKYMEDIRKRNIIFNSVDKEIRSVCVALGNAIDAECPVEIRKRFAKKNERIGKLVKCKFIPLDEFIDTDKYRADKKIHNTTYTDSPFDVNGDGKGVLISRFHMDEFSMKLMLDIINNNSHFIERIKEIYEKF